VRERARETMDSTFCNHKSDARFIFRSLLESIVGTEGKPTLRPKKRRKILRRGDREYWKKIRIVKTSARQRDKTRGWVTRWGVGDNVNVRERKSGRGRGRESKGSWVSKGRKGGGIFVKEQMKSCSTLTLLIFAIVRKWRSSDYAED